MFKIEVTDLNEPNGREVLVIQAEGKVRIVASSQGIVCLIENEAGQIITSTSATLSEIENGAVSNI